MDLLSIKIRWMDHKIRVITKNVSMASVRPVEVGENCTEIQDPVGGMALVTPADLQEVCDKFSQLSISSGFCKISPLF